MKTNAVIFHEPEKLSLDALPLDEAGDNDVIVDVEWSGISSGTERLLYLGKMPPFPGLAYPLVPGYESVGRIRQASKNGKHREGDRVFIPGARCYGEVNALFGGTSSRLVANENAIIPLPQNVEKEAVLFALAATAHHALCAPTASPPDLIVGHGILGRILARLTLAYGHAAPTVWEISGKRMSDAQGYDVIHPDADERSGFSSIYEASGADGILDTLISRLSKGGEITLAGFYDRLDFAFPAAFMREARLRIAAEFQPSDMAAIRHLVETGQLSLDGLITHTASANDAPDAYRTAFADPDCLHMVLDWSDAA